MSNTVTYGIYTFPSPSPQVGVSASPVFFNNMWVDVDTVTIVGEILGCSYAELTLARENLVNFLVTMGFESVTVSGSTPSIIPNCKLVSINFPDSNPTRILPYEITLESYNYEILSKTWKVTDPEDKWNIVETDGRILTLTHTVSARGICVSNDDPLTNAKNFVESKLVDPSNYLSILLKDRETTNFIKVSESESVSELNSTYSVTRTFKAGMSIEELSTTYLIRTSFNYVPAVNGESFSTVEISGTVEGGLHNPITGDFDEHVNLEGLFTQSEQLYWTFREQDYSGVVLNNKPIEYSYTLNENENMVSFSLSYNDDPREEDFLNEYSIESAIDNCFAEVSINGVVKFYKYFDPLSLDVDARINLLKVEYQKINTFFLCNEFFIAQPDSNGSKLVNSKLSENVSFNSDATELSYSTSFSNRPNPQPEIFKQISYSCSESLPIRRKDIVETIGGYTVIEYENEIKRQGTKSLEGQFELLEEGLEAAAIDYIEGVIRYKEEPDPIGGEGRFIDLNSYNLTKQISSATYSFSFNWTYRDGIS